MTPESDAAPPEDSAPAKPARKCATRAKVAPKPVSLETVTEVASDKEAAAPKKRRAPAKSRASSTAAETPAVASTDKPKRRTRRKPEAADIVAPDAPEIVAETPATTLAAAPEPVAKSRKAPTTRRARGKKAVQPDEVTSQASQSAPPDDAQAEAPKPEEEDLPPFDTLGLSAPLLKAIEEIGYERPTPIQARAIPFVIRHRDVLGVAQTGTGKTASFTLPMLEILTGSRARARMPRSLILEPTRELALQVSENLNLYGKHLNLNHALLIGGESMMDQRAALNQGVDILIATPGRLLDLYDRGGLLLNQAGILVIDEADRMLDMGFIPDVQRITSLLPAHRQTLFFSATMAPEIRSLADQFLRDPEEITVSRPSSVATTIEEALIIVEERGKRRTLRTLLQRENVQNAIVFCNRKRDVDILQKSLHKHHFSVGHLHGDLHQATRFKTLEQFKNGDIKILVCSDVAARGIDIGGLSHVFNFDLPFNAEDYVHRIGRTGRAGKTGHAFSLATPTQKPLLDAIEELTHKKLPQPEIDGVETVDWRDEADPRTSRQRNHRQKERKPAETKRDEVPHQGQRERHRDGKRPSPRQERDNIQAVTDHDGPGFGSTVPNFMNAPRRNRVTDASAVGSPE
ncbi:DEAD/DEAH box helicase [Candidatus Kirkpatrickella diaphorinae]|uniref:DEAD/DEAH box helicase n=1 Tax=Candidatus Kirkpatrickella diaphorinae TaxID=2984322 RepID=A0ABY6GJN4_9PROT|nr:DEAD/DEAH box helicase [Candidatus Kirkpatrickella diaphorinae]